MATPQEIEIVIKATKCGDAPDGACLRGRRSGAGYWLGRKGDGPPGWQTLWRGYQRLADMLLGIELLTASDPPEDDLPNLTGYG